MIRLLMSVLIMLMCSLCAFTLPVQPKSVTIPNGNNVPVVSGRWRLHNEQVSMAGKIYDWYACEKDLEYFQPWDVVLDVHGYTHFIAYVGKPDGPTICGLDDFEIRLEGQIVKSGKYIDGREAILVDLPLNGNKSLSIKLGICQILAEPKLVKGEVKLPPPPPGKDPKGGPVPPPPPPPAPFSIKTKDIERLVVALRKRIDDKLETKENIDKCYMALSTFNLIDIPSPSVAKNVAEDLYTKLINANFHLVERGQLDKQLLELKIQNTALIDPATAQKLGKIIGCSYIIVGSVSDRGVLIVINARIIETATGKDIVADSVECEKILIQRGTQGKALPYL